MNGQSGEPSISTWAFFFFIKSTWVMIICSSDVSYLGKRV